MLLDMDEDASLIGRDRLCDKGIRMIQAPLVLLGTLSRRCKCDKGRGMVLWTLTNEVLKEFSWVVPIVLDLSLEVDMLVTMSVLED